MSLMVWLPLNGDVKNQGLSGISLSSNSTPVYDNNGKIGKCYSTSTFLYNDNYTELSDGIFSVAYWVKYTSFPQYNEYCVSLNGTSSSDYMFMIGVQTASGLLSVNTSSSGTSLSLNKWYHVAYTYDGTTGILYLDGIKIKTWTGFTCNKSATHLTINGRYGSRPTHSGSYLNDVRIYDHCLSTKEVKEISKGLVLHFPMDNNGLGNPNLVVNSQQLNNLFSSAGTSAWTRSYTNEDGQSIWTATCTTAGGGGVHTPLFPKATDKIGKQYTWSCRVKASRNVTLNMGSECGGTASKNITTEWQYFTHTWTFTDATYSSFVWYISGTWAVGDWLKVKDLKIEEGSKATPWCPNSADDLYSAWGMNSNIEYDCSGYNHNGTRVQVTTSENTPRNKVCEALLGTTVDTTSNTITGAAYIAAGLPMPTSSAMTVSWWGKITKYGRGGIFETTSGTNGNVENADYSTTAFANWDGTFGVYNGSSRVNLYSNMGVPNSSWQLNTITFDGANVKYYKNGVLVSTNALTGTLPAFNSIRIGIGRAGGVYRQIQQYVSDFRIYVTALSADDVKELYQIPISVDKDGNTFAMEYIEESSPNFYKTGIVENSYIHENEADDTDSLKTFHMGKTKTFANQIYEV